jgi:HAD superfamily hydrolase (TIGR01509 family)
MPTRMDGLWPLQRDSGVVTDIEALLIDMDGTIVDSEPYWIEAEHQLVEEFGGTWGPEDAHSLVGSDLLDSAVVLRERGGVQLEPHALVERLLDGVVDKCREHLPWRPGARELLLSARAAGIPCVLVTMSWRRLADVVLAESPAGVFVGSITGDEVANGKPAPDAYVAAAALVGADPTRCLAIEDSPTGVASALAAGCRTIAVPHVVPVEQRPGLVILDSLVGYGIADLAALA